MKATVLGTMGLAITMLLASVAGCSSDDNTPSGPAGTGGSGTGGSGGTMAGGNAATSFRADSEAICLTLLKLACPQDQAATCADTWNEQADFLAQSGCGTKEKALYDCLATRPPSDFVCDSRGIAIARGETCGPEQVAVNDCNSS